MIGYYGNKASTQQTAIVYKANTEVWRFSSFGNQRQIADLAFKMKT